MSIQDLRKIELPTSLEADLCLVGGGVAAWAIAAELSDSGLQILILESGGSRIIDEIEELNITEDVGVPLFKEGRRRALGGTTEHTGWGNRCIAYDAIDFEQRSWVPHSGWPFGPEQIQPHLDAASEFLGAGPYLPQGSHLGKLPARVVPPSIDESKIRNIYWCFGRDETGDKTRIGKHIRRKTTNKIRVLVHATVTHLNTPIDGKRIDSVEVSDPAGRRFTVKAQAVVLCTGGIENARMLLASNRYINVGLGNEHDVVGRFLMDHPRDLDMAISFDPQDGHRVRRLFGPFRYDNGSGAREYVGGLALSEELQRRDELLNCAAWTFEDVAQDCPHDALVRVMRRDSTDVVDDLGVALRQPRAAFRAVEARAYGQPATHKVKRTGLIIGSEQRPDPDSRVTLSQSLDRFGVPLARTEWRIHEQERASQATLARLIATEFTRLDLPKPILADWVMEGKHALAHLVDGCHPISTTRMSLDPRSGVVDGNCQVHGVHGLYVAGSSVFPTASHANPTLMIAAIAMRLARHLRSTVLTRQSRHLATPENSLRKSYADESTTDLLSMPGVRVAVTGATGFIGGRLVERLLGAGWDVTCLTRHHEPSLERRGARVVPLDLTDDSATRAALAGVKQVFHCAYNWSDEAWNLRATRSLVEACLANSCERLVHVSSFVVYDTPHDGDFTEEAIDSPSSSGYSYTKQRIEANIIDAVKTRGLNATIIQPTIVYGPKSGPWTHDVADVFRYGTLVLPSRGEGVCNAVYVDDVVSAMVLATRENTAIGRSYLVSGPPVTWAQFYGAMATALDAPGPVYLSPEEIVSENRKLRRIRRLLSEPNQILRFGAKAGLGRAASKLILKVLPHRLQLATHDRLFGPWSRQRGHVHMPDLGKMRWMESKSKVTSARAMRELGYRPRYDLAAGMVPTSDYLKSCYVKGSEWLR